MLGYFLGFPFIIKGENQESYAVCVTGQLSRLEMASKVQNLIGPLGEAGHRVDIFMSLTHEEAYDIHGTSAEYQIAVSPFFQEYKDRGTIDWQEQIPGSKAVTPRGDELWNGFHGYRPQSYDIAWGGNASTFGLHVKLHASHLTHAADGHLRGKADVSRIKGKISATKFEQFYVSQWSDMYHCAELIEEYEYMTNQVFSAVIRLSDDGTVLGPVSVGLLKTGGIEFKGIRELQEGGLHESAYIVGRIGAMCFLRAFYFEYFHDHTSLRSLFSYTSEEVAHLHAERCGLSISPLPLCELPVISTFFSASGPLGFRRDVYSRLTDDSNYQKWFAECPNMLEKVADMVKVQRSSLGYVQWIPSKREGKKKSIVAMLGDR